MSSGFIEIAALGQQDVYLTGSPDVTYFASVYKRHTPFVLESFEVPFEGSSIQMGQNNIVRIPVKGDLVRATTLKLSLPPLAEYGQDWFWLNLGGSSVAIVGIGTTDDFEYTVAPAGQQYYSSSEIYAGYYYYDQNLNKFIFYGINSYIAVYKFTPSLGQTGSGIFWGLDPKNATYEDETFLYYVAVNGKVIPDFTLEQAGWARSIGQPINTCQGLFLNLNTTVAPTGYVNFTDKLGLNPVWTSEDSPTRYRITNGGRINITVLGTYIIRASFKGSATIQFGSDANDGQPNTTQFWSTNSLVSSNPLQTFSQPINLTDTTQNWYVFINGHLEPGSYISIQPIDGYYGRNVPYTSANTYPVSSGNIAEIGALGLNGSGIAPGNIALLKFHSEGSWLLSGVFNTVGTGLISSITIITQSGQLVGKYDLSRQLSDISSEFFIPLSLNDAESYYNYVYINTVNGQDCSIDLSTSFITFTYLGLPGGDPSGGFVLPLNGLLFEPVGNVVANPLNFETDFIKSGVENMISIVDGAITFNNVGTYMMTTYLPLFNTDVPPITWDQQPNELFTILSNQNLTATYVPDSGISTTILTQGAPVDAKSMFSVTIDKLSSNATVGICNSNKVLGDPLGTNTDSWAYYKNGTTFDPDDFDYPVGPQFTEDGDVVDIAINTEIPMVWVRVNGGIWSNSQDSAIAGNPTDDQSSGYSLSFLNATDGIYNFGINTTGQITYNTSNLYDIPSGYSFISGYTGTIQVTNINSYTNVNFQDTIFGTLGIDIAMDSNKNLYFQDLGLVILKNSSIYVGVTQPSDYSVNGTGLSCQCAAISGMAFDSQDWLYFGDEQGVILRVVYPGQFVRTIAGGGTEGDGSGFDATFTSIISIKTYGSYVYIQDGGYDNTTIRRYDKSSGEVSTFYKNIGFDINAAGEALYGFLALAVNPSTGALYGALGVRIVSLNPNNGNLTTISGIDQHGFYDGLTGETTTFNSITAMVATATYIYVSDSERLRRVDIVTGGTTTYDGSLGGFFQNPKNPVGFYVRDMVLKDGALYFTKQNLVQKFDFVNQLSNVYGNGAEGFRTTGGSYTQNIPIRVDTAPMTYPVSIGHAGDSFAPGAFVWVYPITSGVLPPDYSQYHYYDSVGTWAIETAELKIGGQTIETLTGEAIEIWNDLNVPYENQPALKLLTGKYDTTIASGRDYYVNLPFYFYGKPQNYLPICAVSRQDVEIWITFRTLQELTTITTSNNPVNATIIVEYVYLGTPEFNWFLKTQLEYVVDQYQYQEINLETGFNKGNFLLNFQNPVDGLFFVIEIDGSAPYDWYNDGLYRLGLSFNGEEIMTNRITDATQLGVIEPFNNFINFPTRNFYMKVFESPINLTRIRYVMLTLDILRSDSYYPSKKLRITAKSKNVLRFSDGLAGLMFISQ